MATPPRDRARRGLRLRRTGFELLQDRWMLAADTCREDEPLTEVAVVQSAAKPFPITDMFLAADAAGSTRSTAYDLGELSSPVLLPGSVGLFDPSDVFRFTVSETSQVSLALRGLQADIDLYLLDSNGRLLAWSDRLGRASESIKATLRAGEYYVQISSWLEAVSPYAFSASATPLAPVPSNPPPTPPIGQPADPTPPVAALPDVPYFGSLSEWNLNVINAPEPWAAGYTGEGVLVAVVDTGVDVNHPDLMSQLFVNAGEIAGNGIDDDGNGFIDDISGWDFVSSDNNADDGNGHGTHVAGTIAAANNGTGVTGVAPGAGQHMVGG